MTMSQVGIVEDIESEDFRRVNQMRMEILNKGDRVLSVTNEFIVVQRKNKEVDILPLLKTSLGWRIDTENVMTVGYRSNIVSMEQDGIKIIHF